MRPSPPIADRPEREPAVIEFQDGLPGFEHHRRFVIVTDPSLEPFAILRGLGPDAPSFATISPERVVEGYEPVIGSADLARLAAKPGTRLLWLAIVQAATDGTATANLRAPLVINPESLRGLQVIPTGTAAGDSPYRFDHPLRAA